MPDTELFNRYRCLRAISTRHHSGALALGLPYGRTPSTESEEEMTLLSTWQLIQPSQADRVPSDRYAKSVTVQPCSDEGLILRSRQCAKRAAPFGGLSVNMRP